jgi:hypothetical protein
VGFPGRVNLSATRNGPGFLAGAIEPGKISFSGGAEWLGVSVDKRFQRHLGAEQFEQFVLPHLSVGRRGPAPKLSLHKIFNYVSHVNGKRHHFVNRRSV